MMSVFEKRPSAASSSVLSGGEAPTSYEEPLEASVTDEDLWAPHVPIDSTNLGRGIERGEDAWALSKDRAAARKELARKFTVVDDDFEGERLPNQVTQAEYEQIVSLYSDVRLGRTDLVIDPSSAKDPDAYRANLMDDLGDILQTETGRELVTQLAHNTRSGSHGEEIHHKTTLMPRVDANGELNPSGAWTASDTTPGQGTFDAEGQPGVGIDPTISFNPNMAVRTGLATFRSDTTLYHEMVHALNATQGTVATGVVEEKDAARTNQRGNAIEPDAGVLDDAMRHVDLDEEKALGIGRFRSERFGEDRYREERRRVARSGQGLAGDESLPIVDRYLAWNGQDVP